MVQLSGLAGCQVEDGKEVEGMISKRTALTLAEDINILCGDGGSLDVNELRKLLFLADLPSDLAGNFYNQGTIAMITNLYSGELFLKAGAQDKNECQKTGNNILRRMAFQTLVVLRERYGEDAVTNSQLLGELELDGYSMGEKGLVRSEAEIVDTKEEAGLLERLYTELGLGDSKTTLHFLQLSEDAYINGRWDAAVQHARQTMESVLLQCAVRWAGQKSPPDMLTDTAPAGIRRYLEREGILDDKEVAAVQHSYGLVSNKGSHVHVCDKDEARLTRHIVLSLTQYVMLELKKKLP